MVRDDLKSANNQISAVRDEVKGLTGTVTELFSKTEADLNASIGKVGKPDPLSPPQLQFGLWNEDPRIPAPVLASGLHPDKDGIFVVNFVVSNISKTAARSIDIWVDICDACLFAKEPAGFFRPSGMRDQTRYHTLPLLNPGASSEKLTVEIKLKGVFATFAVGMRYSCEICEKMAETQVAHIVVLPPEP
jgi:hypothetical protein